MAKKKLNVGDLVEFSTTQSNYRGTLAIILHRIDNNEYYDEHYSVYSLIKGEYLRVFEYEVEKVNYK